MKRLTRTRWPTSSVGSIDREGIWYGLTTKAWIRSARPIASATMTTSSTSAPRCRFRLRASVASSESAAARRRLLLGLRDLCSTARSARRLDILLVRPAGSSSARASAPRGLASPGLLGLLRRGVTSTSASSWATPSESIGAASSARDDQVVLDAPAALGDAGALADAAAQVVELGPAHVAAGDDLEPLDLRRVQRERPLDADAERLLADGEGLARAAALSGR